MTRHLLIIILVFTWSNLVFSQNYNNGWQSLGPHNKPSNPDNNAASGVGPVEFIRVFQKDPNFLLAGSLSGGLFISENKGSNWLNAGSDYWEYSGCGWADFYPENKSIIFAYSNVSDNNGKPGRMGYEGGLMRTLNGGTTWENIMSYTLFGSEQAVIYGTRFDPKNPNRLFVLTSNGLYYTEKCIDQLVSWKKVAAFDGMIYDMDFLDDFAYVSSQFGGVWSVYQLDCKTLNAVANKQIATLTNDKRTITIEPKDSLLLILIDYSKLNDELWEFNPKTGEAQTLISSVQVNFGSGHTFKVNPHNSNLIFVGNSVTLKSWNYTNLREQKIGSGYHVDVEFIEFDPSDSNRIYMACHGGIYISSDKGSTWQNSSDGLAIAEVMGMDVSMTDADEIAIGCFHDGSSVLADFDKNKNYYWRTVNGGDALIPLIDPTDASKIFTSNQYSGGGIYFSNDTAKSVNNIHYINGMNTSGWELAATLYPKNPNTLFFNYARTDKDGKGNIEIARSSDAYLKKKNAEQISDFKKTHQLESYKVYGLFNSEKYPEMLYAYVLNFVKDENGKGVTQHRLFRTNNALDSAQIVIDSWYELELPLSSWLGDVETHPSNPDLIYVSYVGSQDVRSNPELTKGLIYSIKYNKKTHALKKAVDITRNIPDGISGRFNLMFKTDDANTLFFATRSGVYVSNAKTLKGKSDWIKIGQGLPHCKIYSLHYHSKANCLTVGLFGRGVWRYYF